MYVYKQNCTFKIGNNLLKSVVFGLKAKLIIIHLIRVKKKKDLNWYFTYPCIFQNKFKEHENMRKVFAQHLKVSLPGDQSHSTTVVAKVSFSSSSLFYQSPLSLHEPGEM